MRRLTAADKVRAWLATHLRVLDRQLLAIMAILATLGLFTLYSAALDNPARFWEQVRNMVVAALVMLVCANLSMAWLQRLAVPVYVAGVLLLIAVALFGFSAKGAKRWLDLGVTRIQPSEMLKLGVPLLLAWYFHRREGVIRAVDFLIAVLLMLVPVVLIARQPDLGTALLIFAAGGFVVFLAGLPWRWLVAVAAVTLAAAPFAWMHLRDYQRNRVLTLIDPAADPLGKGFHALQSMIAIGSGGFFGKGWTHGTQAHLEFIPERTTDFIFAVYSEEFGLAGNLVLLVLYLALVGRAIEIAVGANTVFSRLLAGAIALVMFTYAVVNMGMVSGALPVVGVPLPFVSYGGTALVTLAMLCGILMAIRYQRKAER